MSALNINRHIGISRAKLLSYPTLKRGEVAPPPLSESETTHSRLTVFRTSKETPSLITIFHSPHDLLSTVVEILGDEPAAAFRLAGRLLGCCLSHECAAS